MNRNPIYPTDDDNAILDLFFARDERAISETDRRYGKACMQVSMGVLNSHPDAEECVNDTYLRAWNTIPPTRPQSLCAYVCRIARNLSISRLREMTAAKRSRDLTVSLSELAACIPAPDEGDRELPRLISAFLRESDDLDRRLFVGRYWYGRSVKDLATAHGIRAGLVYKRLERTRDDLRVYLTERGYTV